MYLENVIVLKEKKMLEKVNQNKELNKYVTIVCQDKIGDNFLEATVKVNATIIIDNDDIKDFSKEIRRLILGYKV
jgi:hypothetical protein